MSPKIQLELDKIEEFEKRVGDVVWPAADHSSLERLRAYMRRIFRMELPPTYVELMSKRDGLEFNATMIFGVNTHRAPYLSSIEEVNEILVATPRRHAFFGSSELDLYAYGLEDKRWHILDRTDLDPLKDFEDFDSLLLHVLREACESLPGT